MVSAQAATEPAPDPRPGPDRNALRLRPLDEVGDDQEVAGKTHRDDHRRARNPAVRDSARGSRASAPIASMRRSRPSIAMARTVSSSVLPARTFGETGSSGLRVSIITAQRRAMASVLSQASGRSANSMRMSARRLEPVLRRDAAALGFGQQAALGDRQQRVVRLMHVGRGEVAVVGGDQRDAGGVSERDQPRFDSALAGKAMAMQFRSRRDPGNASHSWRAGVRPPASDPRPAGAPSGPVVPPVSRISLSACAAMAVERKLRLQTRVGIEEAARRQPLKIGEPDRVLRQQHERVRRQARVIGAGQRDLAADDRLDALRGAGLAEFQRAEQVGGIGDRHCRHARLARQSGDLVRP